MKKKSQQIQTHRDFIIYISSHVSKMHLFWSQLNANNVLPHVSIFNYFKYKYNNYFEIIWDIQFKCLDDFKL
jgi:hypothetical protein